MCTPAPSDCNAAPSLIPNERHRLFDMHCHLSQMTNADEVARKAEAAGLALFDCGVEPGSFAQQHGRFGHSPNVRVGAGLHPWWLSDGRCGQNDIDELCAIAQQERFIGEVGLDFSHKHEASRELQTKAFDALCSALAAYPLRGRIVSVHAVQSAGTALDILEAHGLIGKQASQDEARSPAIIFHWFSGSGDELTRARKAGCYFSVNEMMLNTRRGRAYARQIPENRLLLETDAPPMLGKPYSASALRGQLDRTLGVLADTRSISKRELIETIAKTSAGLLGMD